MRPLCSSGSLQPNCRVTGMLHSCASPVENSKREGMQLHSAFVVLESVRFRCSVELFPLVSAQRDPLITRSLVDAVLSGISLKIEFFGKVNLITFPIVICLTMICLTNCGSNRSQWFVDCGD